MLLRKPGQTDLSADFCISQEEDAVFLGCDLWNFMACNLQASEYFELSQKNPRAKTERNATKKHPF